MSTRWAKAPCPARSAGGPCGSAVLRNRSGHRYLAWRQRRGGLLRHRGRRKVHRWVYVRWATAERPGGEGGLACVADCPPARPRRSCPAKLRGLAGRHGPGVATLARDVDPDSWRNDGEGGVGLVGQAGDDGENAGVSVEPDAVAGRVSCERAREVCAGEGDGEVGGLVAGGGVVGEGA